MGVATSSVEEIEAGLERAAAETWLRPFDPVMEVRQDEEPIRVRIPGSRRGATINLEIQWEDGGIEHRWFWLPELRLLERGAAGGVEFLTKRLPLPQPRPLGYH